jgi:hypothetical protein
MRDIASEAAVQSDDACPSGAASILHPLADELLAIATRLRDAAVGAPGIEAEPQVRPLPPRSTQSHLALARKTYALRRKRAAIFGNLDLFGEPAWDILLDLFIAYAEGKPVSVSSACIGSAAPATTGLRWLGVLADQGLVVRENDADDQRRVMVRLTQAGRLAMERFFDAVQEARI